MGLAWLKFAFLFSISYFFFFSKEYRYIPTIQNYPQIDVNDLFGKKDIKKNNKDAEANNKNKININETMLNETGRDLLTKLGEAYNRVSKLERDLSEKDRDISEKDHNLSQKDREIQDLRDLRKCKVCMEKEVCWNLFNFGRTFLIVRVVAYFCFLSIKVDQVFIPCGHVICCKICITRLQICPICRKPIDDTLLAYFS